MTEITWREAAEQDVPAVAALLADDVLGAGRERSDLTPYLDAFAQMQAEPHNRLIVGVDPAGRVLACYQLTLMSGLSLAGARRAQVEGVRVHADLRGQGVGEMMFDDAIARARGAGCRLMQLTTNATRSRAHAFYEGLGFTASHIGFKRDL